MSYSLIITFNKTVNILHIYTILKIFLAAVLFIIFTMQLLQPILSVLYIAGISLHDQQSKWYKMIRIIWIAAMLIFLIGMVYYKTII